MNKQELLEKIDSLIKECQAKEKESENELNKMWHLGQINGLYWAKLFLLDLEEKKDESNR